MKTRPPAILVDHLWVSFRAFHDKALSIKEVASRLRFARGVSVFWALKDVCLEVPKGQTLGLIGENGSGKSTLLRCIAGIYEPSRGQLLVSGPVATLIELGAGFHPELTGRENASVTGALFGLSRRQLAAKFDRIVEFAELESVIDHPVRSYSSGMQVRLAFSLAVHVDPEILLIDEVLAVGDEGFQRKCIERIRELQTEGITVVIVSHALDMVRNLCERCILLDGGSIVAAGDTNHVVDEYLHIKGLA